MDESILAGIFFLGLGVYCSIKYTIQYLSDNKSRKWPKTPGRVSRSEVILEGDTSFHLSPKKILVKKDEMYTDCIEYIFKVAGKEFKGNRFRAIEQASNIRSWEGRYVEKYPLGKTVQVFYNPQNPNESLLATALLSQNVYLVILLLSALAIGFGIYLIK